MSFYCNGCGLPTKIFFQKESLIETTKGVIQEIQLNVCKRCITIPFVTEPKKEYEC